jgi:hypothetical protein
LKRINDEVLSGGFHTAKGFSRDSSKGLGRIMLSAAKRYCRFQVLTKVIATSLARGVHNICMVIMSEMFPALYLIFDLRGTEWCGLGWIDLAEDRGRWKAFVNAVMNLRVQ